ncbi:MAG: M14 family zinc carboxypeptidase [Flavobacteriaceae bacterium]|nr:M14 family zinc carboxypeptidase [Flavobacteriaceae bacterium]
MRFLFCSLLLFPILKLQSQIQTPDDFLGCELGDQFTFHHHIEDYFKHLDKHSNYLKLIQYGKTYEGRSLYLAFLSSQENLENLEEYRTRHLEGTKLPTDENKVIIWLSYGVHGNESSSSEAAMKTAHILLTEKISWLNDAIIILDPCLNPDGRERYVQFFKQSKSTPNSVNSYLREHSEPWHSGRTNHYIFDLNRDWAWLTQIESQHRMKYYQKWLPHIHVDFHEQGINNPYYFAPASEPYHDIITRFQRKFQIKIGENNAKYFDQNGWLYFTKQVFDLLYPGYGDTYPTFSGAIGMTYEQAGGGRAGLGVITETGHILTLNERINHHVTSGLSTIEVSLINKEALINQFQQFHQSQNPKFANYVLSGPKSSISNLAEFLSKHGIITQHLSNKQNIRGYDFQTQNIGNKEFEKGSLIVSALQPKGKLVQVLFEPQTVHSDSLTYDITSWALPYNYGLESIGTNQKIDESSILDAETFSPNKISDTYGYGIPYESFEDSKFISSLLKESLTLRYSKKDIKNSDVNWRSGSFFILKADNQQNSKWRETTIGLANKFKKRIYDIETGYSESGADMGSSDLKLVKKKKIALLYDTTSSQYRYGEIWHFFERQLNYPLAQIPSNQLSGNLHEYDILILPEGVDALSKSDIKDSILDWVKLGGKLILMGKTIESIEDIEEFKIVKKKTPEIDYSLVPLEERSANQISYSLTGSIYSTSLDSSHPITFGIDRYYSLRTLNSAFSLLKEGENAIYIDNKNNHVSGFSGYKINQLQENLLLFGSQRISKGKVIYMIDNPLFRGFWYQGKQLFFNALWLD